MRIHKKPRAVGIGASVMTLLLGCCAPWVVAQPAAIDADVVADVLTGDSPEQRADKAWETLRKAMKEADTKEPAKSIDAYTQFLDAYPGMSVDRGVDVHIVIAHLHEGLKQMDQALEFYDAGLEAYGKHPQMVFLLDHKARFLERRNRVEEASAMLEEWWPRVSNSYSHFAEPILRTHTDLSWVLKKRPERLRVTRRAMMEFPVFLSGRPSNYEWMYGYFNLTLSEEKKEVEALSWAKLRFMTSPYEADALDRATKMLAQTWSAVDKERTGLKAFAKAQKEAGAPNPLREVPLPVLEEELLESLQARFNGKSLEDRNIWRIASGTPQGLVDAMTESRALCDSTDKAQATEGALEVCRLFKASDLHMRRATAFLKFLKSREGDDPTAAFVQQQGKPAA